MPVGGSQTTDQRSHNNLNEITQLTITGQAPYTPQYDLNGNTEPLVTSNLSPVTSSPYAAWRFFQLLE